MSETVEQAAIFDAAHLAKYTLGDVVLEREVLQMFFDQSKIYLERLRTAGTNEQWHDAAHSLKGSARGVGAFKVGAHAETLEKDGMPQTAEQLAVRLAVLAADLQEFEMVAQQHLG